MIEAEDILNFWFYEVGQERWFEQTEAMDKLIHDRFLPAHELAVKGELDSWADTPEGTLALLLLLDEFPRRMFRGTPRAFASDDLALELARDSIIKHYDDRIASHYKMLFYLPFLNSESVSDQRLAIFYIRERAKDNEWLSKAELNHEIVQRFGRFPQRNPVLGRSPTAEEQQFLERVKAAGYA